MLNTVSLAGRIAQTPVLQRTSGDAAYVRFSIACDRDYRQADKQRETDFIPCMAWRQTAEFLCQHFQKGSAVIVAGRLEVNSWKTPDGEQRREMLVSVDNVYFGESKPKEAQTPAQV